MPEITVRRNDQSVSVGDDAPLPIGFTPDAQAGKLTTYHVTTSATINQARRVAIPAWAKGVRMYANTNNSRFAVDEVPGAAPATVAAGITDVTDTADAIGGVLKKDAWEVRLLHPDATWLHVISGTASTVIDIEFFG